MCQATAAHDPMDSSQTFTVSELGYSGLFSFGGSETDKYGSCGNETNSSTVGFSAPAGVSVSLGKSGKCIFGHGFVHGSSYAVLVRDSLGNSITIYTN